MWCLTYTSAEVCSGIYNDAVVDIEAYTNEHDAEDAMRKKYAEEVAALSKELEYSEYDSNNRTARIYGEVTVVVLGVQEVNVKQKEVK